jgi:hypothetical protein
MARVGHGLKFRPGPPCPTLLCPVGGPPLKQPYRCFRGFPPAGQLACGRLLPLWTPHAVDSWEQNTVFGIGAVSENFENANCAIRKVVTSSTHGCGADCSTHRPTPAYPGLLPMDNSAVTDWSRPE